MNAKPDADGSGTSAPARYARALIAFLSDRCEANLAAAYQCGREALDRGQAIADVVEQHHRAFAGWCRSQTDAPTDAAYLAAGHFLAETLAPYEMARRGVVDAIHALRALNESLEHEAQRIARAVHDEAGQLTLLLHLSFADLARSLPPGDDEVLHKAGDALTQVEQRLRQLSHELRPSLLDDLGWLPAIRWLAGNVSERRRLAVDVRATEDVRLPPAMETALYRVVQEALTNVVRHAHAGRVTIEVAETAGSIALTITDDGRGFDVTASRFRAGDRGLGLVGMRERLAAVGGTFRIDSRPGCGTTLAITIPRVVRNDAAIVAG